MLTFNKNQHAWRSSCKQTFGVHMSQFHKFGCMQAFTCSIWNFLFWMKKTIALAETFQFDSLMSINKNLIDSKINQENPTPEQQCAPKPEACCQCWTQGKKLLSPHMLTDFIVCSLLSVVTQFSHGFDICGFTNHKGSMWKSLSDARSSGCRNFHLKFPCVNCIMLSCKNVVLFGHVWLNGQVVLVLGLGSNCFGGLLCCWVAPMLCCWIICSEIFWSGSNCFEAVGLLLSLSMSCHVVGLFGQSVVEWWSCWVVPLSSG